MNVTERRKFLTMGAGSLAVLLSGCAGNNSENPGQTPDPTSQTSTTATTGTSGQGVTTQEETRSETNASSNYSAPERVVSEYYGAYQSGDFERADDLIISRNITSEDLQGEISVVSIHQCSVEPIANQLDDLEESEINDTIESSLDREYQQTALVYTSVNDGDYRTVFLTVRTDERWRIHGQMPGLQGAVSSSPLDPASCE